MASNIIKILENINTTYEKKRSTIIILKNMITLKTVGPYKLAPGLANLSNTCFHNSGMQLLFRISELTDFLINPTIRKQYNPSSYIQNFINLLQLMHDNSNNSFTGNFLSRAKLFNVPVCLAGIFKKKYEGSQEDVPEFIQGILTTLAVDCPFNELNMTQAENNNNICVKEHVNTVRKKKFPANDPRNFMFTKIIHNVCKWKKVPSEYYDKNGDYKGDEIIIYGKDSKNFNELKQACTHKITEQESYNYLVELKLNNDNKNYSIDELIKIASDPFYKNNSQDILLKAKRDENGMDYLYVETTNYIPNKYLLIQLGMGLAIGTKIKHHVKLEANGILNFEYYINGIKHNQEYELIGISYHSGPGLAFGHYTANIKHEKQWYDYDDSVITLRSDYAKEYLTDSYARHPYLILYRQKSGKPIEYINPDSIPDSLNVIDYLDNL